MNLTLDSALMMAAPLKTRIVTYPSSNDARRCLTVATIRDYDDNYCVPSLRNQNNEITKMYVKFPSPKKTNISQIILSTCKYFQIIFSDFVNHFPVCHRKKTFDRVLISRNPNIDTTKIIYKLYAEFILCRVVLKYD